MITLVGILLVIVGWFVSRSHDDSAVFGMLLFLGGIVAIIYGLCPVFMNLR